MKKLTSFLFGFVAALAAIIIELVFFTMLDFANLSPGIYLDFLLLPQFLILFAFIEELTKLIIFSKTIAKKSEGLKAIMLNTLLMGAGFGTMELIMLYLKNPAAFAMFDSLAIWLLHIGTAGIFACTYSLTRRWIFISIIISTSLHALFNLLFQQVGTAHSFWEIMLLAVIGLFVFGTFAYSNNRLRSA